MKRFLLEGVYLLKRVLKSEEREHRVRTSTPSFNWYSDNMGAEISSMQAPLSVNIELTVGEEELAKAREFLRNITGEGADREEHATRQAGAHDVGGAGNVTTTGGAGVTRAGGAVSTATRQSGAHYGGGAGNATTTGVQA